MAPQRPMKLVFKKSEQGAPIDLLEFLSESRISVLCLARQAKEAKNKVLAKELTEKGQSLRTQMARLRRTVTIEWTK